MKALRETDARASLVVTTRHGGRVLDWWDVANHACLMPSTCTRDTSDYPAFHQCTLTGFFFAYEYLFIYFHTLDGSLKSYLLVLLLVRQQGKPLKSGEKTPVTSISWRHRLCLAVCVQLSLVFSPCAGDKASDFVVILLYFLLGDFPGGLAGRLGPLGFCIGSPEAATADGID